jgi:MoxR-like ATPase
VIEPIDQAVLEQVLDAAGLALVDLEAGGPAAIDALSVADIEAQLTARNLKLPPGIARQAHAAILAGKHLLVMGAPGTGKTSFAEALAEAARSVGATSGYLQTTGSSDWTPSDTVGTYRMNVDQQLEFVAGQILQAIDDDAWVILDELNRADIDRAIGPLFTVLSGQSTVLRFEVRTEDGEWQKVAVVPEGVAAPPGTRPYVVGSSWRLVATMNTRDRDVLFEISQALLRRLAVLELPVPARADHVELLAAFATGDDELDERMARLVDIPGVPLGPAITIDCARYAQERHTQALAAGEALPAGSAFTEAVALLVESQLVALPGEVRQTAAQYLHWAATAAPGAVWEEAAEAPEELAPAPADGQA